MSHDIFISYSSKDKPIADGICASLEAAGLRCWIAPRDIAAGEEWPKAITHAIATSQVMVLIFSANSNASSDVGREIVLAANQNLVIIPFKIENVEPEDGKKYYLAQTHWLEAMNPPTKAQIRSLVDRVRMIIPPFDPNAMAQPGTIPPPATMQHNELAPAARPGWFRRAALWIGISLLLILLVITNWPKIQGMLASPPATPTLTATVTSLPSPTETILPTLTPIKTVSPTPRASAQPTATTGTVTGTINWGDQPYEGVNIMLCSNWIGACKGLEYNATTDAQGKYSISGVEPGKYQVIKTVAEQYDLTKPDDARDEIQVTAGKTLTFNTNLKCRYDLKVTFSLQSGKVTLRWNKIPGGLSNFYIGDIYWSGGEVHWSSDISYTRTLDAGNYLWYVETQTTERDGYSCAISRFTVP